MFVKTEKASAQIEKLYELIDNFGIRVPPDYEIEYIVAKEDAIYFSVNYRYNQTDALKFYQLRFGDIGYELNLLADINYESHPEIASIYNDIWSQYFYVCDNSLLTYGFGSYYPSGSRFFKIDLSSNQLTVLYQLDSATVRCIGCTVEDEFIVQYTEGIHPDISVHLTDNVDSLSPIELNTSIESAHHRLFTRFQNLICFASSDYNDNILNIKLHFYNTDNQLLRVKSIQIADLADYPFNIQFLTNMNAQIAGTDTLFYFFIEGNLASQTASTSRMRNVVYSSQQDNILVDYIASEPREKLYFRQHEKEILVFNDLQRILIPYYTTGNINGELRIAYFENNQFQESRVIGPNYYSFSVSRSEISKVPVGKLNDENFYACYFNNETNEVVIKIYNNQLEEIYAYSTVVDLPDLHSLVILFDSFNEQTQELDIVANIIGNTPSFVVSNYFAKFKFNTLALIEESVEANLFKIFPNPATSTLHITSEGNVLRQYHITDLQGRKMQSAALSNQTATHQIDISQLATGVYLLKVESEKGAVVKRFVKE
jgi:hypothetical protein